jgi:general secretion pathway protein B
LSYILDALKKSEKERSLGHVPTLGAGYQQDEPRVPRRWFLLAVVVGLGTALALFGGWMLWTYGTSKDASAPAKAVTAAEPDKEPPDDASQPRAEEAKGADPEAAPLADFDASFRSRIPDIEINVLSYSEDRSKRFVMIGQEIFKEGEPVDGGVFVEEIRSSDVVFKFGDVRFVLEP